MCKRVYKSAWIGVVIIIDPIDPKWRRMTIFGQINETLKGCVDLGMYECHINLKVRYILLGLNERKRVDNFPKINTGNILQQTHTDQMKEWLNKCTILSPLVGRASWRAPSSDPQVQANSLSCWFCVWRLQEALLPRESFPEKSRAHVRANEMWVAVNYC